MLVEIGAVLQPSLAEQEAGKSETLVLPLVGVVANTVNTAILRAGVENADALKTFDLARLQVVVRPVA